MPLPIIRFLRSRPKGAKPGAGKRSGRPRLLNVGANDRLTPIPAYYAGWDQVLLDIDPDVHPDIVCDARQLTALPGAEFDAVYCCHNLEHYYRHDVGKVLHGFRHVLKSDGFVEIQVPELRSVMQKVIDADLDIEDVLYQSAMGPITVRDVIYGFGKEIEGSGHDYFAHKTGFTPRSLHRTLKEAGFGDVFVGVAADVFNMRAFAFMTSATPEQRALLELFEEPS